MSSKREQNKPILSQYMVDSNLNTNMFLANPDNVKMLKNQFENSF